MGRVINPETAGKERSRILKGMYSVAERLITQQVSLDERRDLLAFLVLSLEAIDETIESTVAAWEKRDYWVKADRFRMEWLWTNQVSKQLKEALLLSDWKKASELVDRIAKRLSQLKVKPYARAGEIWEGAWSKLTGS